MRDLINIVSLCESFVKLTDLYTDHELNDENEALYNYVSEDDFNTEFEVKEMSYLDANKLKTLHGDMTVIEAFKDYADNDQKELVKYKMDHFDSNRIVVLSGNVVIDGNHQVVAAILSKKPVKYIAVDSCEI